MVIINKEKEVCKELQTTVQGQETSILDYVLTNSKLLSTVTEMIVDENKQYSAFKLEISSKPCNSNRETKEEQNNYQMWSQKI